jgi:hypothetical protein
MLTIAGGIILAVIILINLEAILEIILSIGLIAIVLGSVLGILYLLLDWINPSRRATSIFCAFIGMAIICGQIFYISRGIYRFFKRLKQRKTILKIVRSDAQRPPPEPPPEF